MDSRDFNKLFYIWVSLLGENRYRTLRFLLEEYGCPEKIAAIKSSDDFTPALAASEKLAENILNPEKKKEAQRICSEVYRLGMNIVTLGDEDYPEYLSQIYAPPLALYYYGTLPPMGANAVAVVGSRGASGYGRNVAYNLSKDLAMAGVIIVSGMARGIDSCAHKGALEVGTPTVAVLGCGVDYIYPPENKDLYRKIINCGAVVSEFYPGTMPQKQFFPARNRIIAGLCAGTLIVEARGSSGALITTDSALRENRTVYAVPGNISSELSLGPNKLIQKGAFCVTCAQDILDDLGIDAKVGGISKIDGLDKNQIAVCLAILSNARSAEEVCAVTNLDVATVLSTVTWLKINGIIEGVGFGDYVVR